MRKIIKILKEIEPYFLILTYAFIGFFIAITGITLLPLIVESFGKVNLVTYFYILSIFLGTIYFAHYKTIKEALKEEKELK